MLSPHLFALLTQTGGAGTSTSWVLLALPVLATTIAIASGVPQLMLMLRTRDATGVSVSGWGTAAASYGAWIAYSLGNGTMGPVLVMVVPAIMTFAVTVLAWLWGGDRRAGAVPFIMVALMLGAFALGNGSAVGLLLASSAVWAYGPNIYAMWTSPDLRGNSCGTWVLSSAYGIVWGGYGFLLHNQTMFYNGLVNAVLAGGVLSALLAVRRVRPLATVTTSTAQFAMISTNTAPLDILSPLTSPFAMVVTAPTPAVTATATVSTSVVGNAAGARSAVPFSTPFVMPLALVGTMTAPLSIITSGMATTETAALRLSGSAA